MIDSLTALVRCFSALVTMQIWADGVRDPLVDVDAEPVDAVLDDRVQHAVAGLAGDLEQDVNVRVHLEELIGEGLAGRRVVEGHREVVAHVLQLDVRIGVDRMHAVLEATHVVHDRRNRARIHRAAATSPLSLMDPARMPARYPAWASLKMSDS